MRFLVKIHIFLNSVQDWLARLVVRFAFAVTKPGVLSFLSLIPAFIFAFILGAYSVPLGIINALVSSFTCIDSNLNLLLNEKGA